MFKPGDIVIAHTDAPYSVTTNGWLGIVVGQDQGSDGWLWVREPRCTWIGFPVNPRYFDKAGALAQALFTKEIPNNV